MLFLEEMVKHGVEAGQLNPGRRQGLRLVVWVQLHLCFIHIPGNGFQVTGSSLLPLEPGPQQNLLRASFEPGGIPRPLYLYLIPRWGENVYAELKSLRQAFQTQWLKDPSNDVGEHKGWQGLRGGGANLSNLKGISVFYLTAVKRKMYPVQPEF